METTQWVRVRLLFEDHTVLSEAQRSDGMNRSWFLIEPEVHRKISDVCNHLLQYFNLHHSCPNGILLYMEGFVLPPTESTRILKDKEIICIKRKGLTLTEAIEGGGACNLVDQAKVNMNEPVNNGMLLLANEEFDKEIGGYESEESEEDEPASPIQIVSKKRKASTKIRSSENKKQKSVVIDSVKDEITTDDDNIDNDECAKIINKKIKQIKEKNSAETVTVKVKSPAKVKRKKNKLNETEKENGEINDEKVKSPSDVKRSEPLQEGVEQTSTPVDGAIKGPSRSARRKKAKRKWKRENAKILQTSNTHLEPEASEDEKKEANGHLDEPLKQDQLPTTVVHKNAIKQEERNYNPNVKTVLVPCVVKPGHIRFEPLDEEDEDVKEIKVPEVSFQWNGITSKKKGQKWGLENSSTFRRDDSQKTTIEQPSTKLSEITEIPLVDLKDFDNLPLCNSPKEGDVIAYRLVELTSSWTPELSSFRVGKISHYDVGNMVLIPVPEYPIVFDEIDDEDGPQNSLYKEDGTLEIKFEVLADVRTVKQSNSDLIQTVSNGVNQSLKGDDKKDKNAESDSISNRKSNNISKDPTPVKETSEATWDELNEVLNAKKAELLEIQEEMKRDSAWDRWSYRALRGSALGPTMALLRSQNNV